MRMSEKEFQALLAKSKGAAAQVPPSMMPKAENKYRNIKVYIYADGYVAFGEKDKQRGKPKMVFDSKKEFDRWNELLLLQRIGKIKNLSRQTKLVIQEKAEIAGKIVKEIAYVADFMYNDADGRTIVEDVKPFDIHSQKHKTTKDFALKWKLLQVKYPKYTFEIF